MSRSAEQEQEMKRRKRMQAGDDDAPPIRQRARGIVEGHVVTAIMTATTIFALFGDDLRVWLTTKEADPYFFAGLFLSLILFTMELLVQSCVVNDFKYSFFFWLDFIATLSLVLDIPWMMDSFRAILNLEISTTSLDVKPGQPPAASDTSQLSRMISSFRLIRLIRIIKLYNYAVKSNTEEEEAKLREQQRISSNPQIALLKKELEPQRIGKHLSDQMTRRLIIGILGMLIFLPLFTYQGKNYSAESGLRELFWFGRSSCKVDDSVQYSFCSNGDGETWLTEEGWDEKLRHYVQSQRSSESDQVDMKLIWLYIPDFRKNGMLSSIKSIKKTHISVDEYSIQEAEDDAEPFWEEHKNCSGFVISDQPCILRQDEMVLVSYRPRECSTQKDKYPNCEDLVAYARFDISAYSISGAQFAFAKTIFTCFLMTMGSLMFSNDTDRIIILPITKMVGIIKQLADDPLQRPEEPIFTDEELKSKAKNNIKTVELQKTIYRIGQLLQMSFGQLGALIIKDNYTSGGDGSLEIMIPGHRRQVIFCVCKMQDYTPITDLLQEESLQFYNQVISILHQCTARWDGWANKTEGEKYILTWKLPEIDETDNEKNEQLLEERTEMADKSLIAVVKIVSEMRRATQINQYFKRQEFIAKLGAGARPTLNFALHMGWTIEGAIGSESKIDACYMSPNLQASYKIEQLCEHYEQQILVSENLYNIMSLKARHTLRKIDIITMTEHKEPLGIYTFDLSFTNQEQLSIPEDHDIGDLIKFSEYETINVESFTSRGVDYMFTLDSDIVGLQQHIGEFNPIFRQAFKCYIQGDWGPAQENIDRCLELWDTDGPTKALQYYMQFYKFEAPNQWNGCRNIDEELDQNKIDQERNYDVEEQEIVEDQPEKDTKSKSSKQKSKKDNDSESSKKKKQ